MERSEVEIKLKNEVLAFAIYFAISCPGDDPLRRERRERRSQVGRDLIKPRTGSTSTGGCSHWRSVPCIEVGTRKHEKENKDSGLPRQTINFLDILGARAGFLVLIVLWILFFAKQRRNSSRRRINFALFRH